MDTNEFVVRLNKVTADQVTQYEVIIDRPAKVIWPTLLN